MKLIGSLSFRLALTYAGLLMVSVGTLAGLYYWIGIHRPLSAIRSEVRAEADRFSAHYSRLGAQGLVPALEARAGAPTANLGYHALLRPDGSAVATNLPSWPRTRSAQWLRIDADISRDGEEDEYEALVFDRPLPGGARLLIGRDIEDLDEREEAIADTAIWLVPAFLLLAVGGGFMMSRAIGHRIEAVDAAARRVMDGDLSERVPVRGTGDDFDRLSTTLNLMLARIEASVEAVRRVSDSVAHELRTPLARLQADLIDLESDLPSHHRERLQSALEEADRLARMFDAVLRISRIEAGPHTARAEPVDLSTLLHDCAELYQPAAEEKSIQLQVNVAPGLTVTGDADLLFQATGNLLDNAVKFTSPGGQIEITAGEAMGSVTFEISDTGPGIPQDIRDRVTERFFRAPAAADIPGYGLGLSLVAAVARVHRSELQFNPARPGLAVSWSFLRDQWR